MDLIKVEMDGHSVQYRQYTSTDSYDLSNIGNCTSYMSRWFLENDMLLNPTKTEAAVFGTRQRLHQIDSSSNVDVVEDNVSFADSVKVLGVTLDSPLTFSMHVTNNVPTCNFHICVLGHIKPFLSPGSAKSIAVSIIVSRD